MSEKLIPAEKIIKKNEKKKREKPKVIPQEELQTRKEMQALGVFTSVIRTNNSILDYFKREQLLKEKELESLFFNPDYPEHQPEFEDLVTDSDSEDLTEFQGHGTRHDRA